jgi:hypothetical protein
VGVGVLINFEIRKKKDVIIYNMKNINKDMRDIHKIPDRVIALGVTSGHAIHARAVGMQNDELGVVYADLLAQILSADTAARSCFDTVTKPQLDAGEEVKDDVTRTLARFYDFARHLAEWTPAGYSTSCAYLGYKDKATALKGFVDRLVFDGVAAACWSQVVNEEARIELYTRELLLRWLETVTPITKFPPYFSVADLREKMDAINTKMDIDNLFNFMKVHFGSDLENDPAFQNIYRHCIARVILRPYYVVHTHTQ